MKKLAIFILSLLILAVVLYALKDVIIPFFFQPKPTLVKTGSVIERHNTDESSLFSVVAQNLKAPWEMAFLPEGDILVTERAGALKRLGSDKKTIEISEAYAIGEGGLLGMALDPGFQTNRYIYLYMTTRKAGKVQNEVVRYVYSDYGALKDKNILLTNIPGAYIHNGGRIKFGPDGYLYVTTGDANQPSLAQDKGSLAGKILRLTRGGQAAPGNPFKSVIYSYGHRNPQGLAWDAQGHLWATEHGPSGKDELNLIEPGKNYGWPQIQGNETAANMISPVLNSGDNDTWAPSGAAFINGSLFFGGLRGQTLYEAKINPETMKIQLLGHFRKTFGRIRSVVKGEDGFLYILTSNRDGRGRPKSDDDKIIRIDPHKLKAT